MEIVCIHSRMLQQEEDQSTFVHKETSKYTWFNFIETQHSYNSQNKILAEMWHTDLIIADTIL